MTKALLVMLARMISGANARWIGCNPDTKQRIYFANHTSHLDALVLWVLLPPAVRSLTRPVAARDYWTAGIIRRHIAKNGFRAILIERKKPTIQDNPITQILEELGGNESIIIFPEGTRSSGPDPAPFKGGIYHLARERPDVELVPVYLENLNRILPKGEVLPVPLLGSATFGAPIHVLESESKREFLERTWKAVVNLRDR